MATPPQDRSASTRQQSSVRTDSGATRPIATASLDSLDFIDDMLTRKANGGNYFIMSVQQFVSTNFSTLRAASAARIRWEQRLHQLLTELIEDEDDSSCESSCEQGHLERRTTTGLTPLLPDTATTSMVTLADIRNLLVSVASASTIIFDMHSRFETAALAEAFFSVLASTFVELPLRIGGAVAHCISTVERVLARPASQRRTLLVTGDLKEQSTFLNRMYNTKFEIHSTSQREAIPSSAQIAVAADGCMPYNVIDAHGPLLGSDDVLLSPAALCGLCVGAALIAVAWPLSVDVKNGLPALMATCRSIRVICVVVKSASSTGSTKSITALLVSYEAAEVIVCKKHDHWTSTYPDHSNHMLQIFTAIESAMTRKDKEEVETCRSQEAFPKNEPSGIDGTSVAKISTEQQQEEEGDTPTPELLVGHDTQAFGGDGACMRSSPPGFSHVFHEDDAKHPRCISVIGSYSTAAGTSSALRDIMFDLFPLSNMATNIFNANWNVGGIHAAVTSVEDAVSGEDVPTVVLEAKEALFDVDRLLEEKVFRFMMFTSSTILLMVKGQVLESVKNLLHNFVRCSTAVDPLDQRRTMMPNLFIVLRDMSDCSEVARDKQLHVINTTILKNFMVVVPDDAADGRHSESRSVEHFVRWKPENLVLLPPAFHEEVVFQWMSEEVRRQLNVAPFTRKIWDTKYLFTCMWLSNAVSSATPHAHFEDVAPTVKAWRTYATTCWGDKVVD